MKIGDVVKFKDGLYADEIGTRYRIIEINGDRAFIEFLNPDLFIPPQSVAQLEDLEILDNAQNSGR